jgi:hypothetical protein
LEQWRGLLMLSDKQRQTALKKNSALARNMAKVMLAHGLDLKVQVLNTEEYFAWLGERPHTYQILQEYPGGRYVSGDEAKALLGID